MMLRLYLGILLYVSYATLANGEKLLVTANEYNSASFVLDLENGRICEPFSDYPESQVWGAGGGLLRGKFPLACDGNEDVSINDCYLYDQDEGWSKAVVLPAAVEWPGSVVLDEDTLWITGGYYNYQANYNLSLLVKPFENVAEPGPALPYEVMTPCMVKWDDDTVAMIGGSGKPGGGPRTSYYTFSSGAWQDGPQLLHRRNVPACASMTLSSGRRIVMVVGSSGTDGAATEYIEPGVDTQWKKGPPLPYVIDVPTMIPVDNQETVIVFGKNYIEEYKGILKYHCANGDPDDCSWTELDLQLPFQVDQPVAMLIPDEIAPSCN